jgi:CBS domain-containing protein
MPESGVGSLAGSNRLLGTARGAQIRADRFGRRFPWVVETGYSHYVEEHDEMMTIEEALRDEKLRNLPVSNPTCVPMGTGLGETLRAMKEDGVGCVLICDGEQLRGIFTERDVLNKVIGARISDSEPIERYMTHDPEVLKEEDRLGDAVRLMTEHGYRHVPLVDKAGMRIGMIAVRDIVHYVAEHFPEEVVNLPPRLHQTFETPEGA